MEYDFFPDLVNYVERKAKSFLEKNGIDGFDELREAAKSQQGYPIDYINNLLNSVGAKVAQSRNDKTIEEVFDELRVHYSSQEM